MEDSTMRTRFSVFSPIATALLIPVALALLMGCSVNVKKNNDEGQDKNVDITTPFGGLHVNNNADARDTGLPPYPGARLKPKSGDNDEKSANVEISTSAFGLKVVALEYLTNDAPGKVIAFYQDQLKKYGKVLQCKTSRGTDYHYNGDSDELKCDGDNSGKTTELKAGTKGNQRIVAVTPEGKGTDFALVYVRTRGKEGTI
jgi:hypothetical protein